MEALYRRLDSMDPDRRRALRHAVLASVAVLVLGTATAAALAALRSRVLTGQVGPASPAYHVRLVGVPSWMPDALAQRIAEQLTPAKRGFGDPALTRDVYERARANPWVATCRQVVRHLPDQAGPATVAVHVDLRQAVAAVHQGDEYTFVDADGVVLPYDHVPRWILPAEDGAGRRGRDRCFISRAHVPQGAAARPIHYMVIEGVQSPPPPPGQRWDASDLDDGLRLIAMLRRRPYATEVAAVDVRNHGWRISETEPQLRLYAQLPRGKGTDILFGRFPHAKGDYIVPPERKMAYLDGFVADHAGRLAGKASRIDLRGDHLTFTP